MLRTVATGHDFFDVAFSPDGSRLIYTRAPSDKADSDIWIAAVTGGAPVALTRGGHSSNAVWGPAWIVFSRSRTAKGRQDNPKLDLYLIKPSGAGLHRLTRTNPPFLLSGLSATAWSANGRRLLAEFGGQDPDDANVVGIPYGGGKLRILARHAHFPNWNAGFGP